MITLTVIGEPAPQGSKSVGRHGGIYEKSRKVKPWRDAIMAAALRQEIDDRLDGQPIRVEIYFRLPRPKGHYGTGRNAGTLKYDAPTWVANRPDLDKLIRSTLDGLKAAHIYGDDGQVAEVTARKVYGEQPGAAIFIHSLTGAET